MKHYFKLYLALIFLFAANIIHAQWIEQTSGTTNNFNGVSFTDANTGTAVGDNGTILRTTDGGANWVSQNSGTTNNLNSVSFTDANTGTAVGTGGVILRTTDGGANWVSQNSGTGNNLTFVSFIDANTGTVVGFNGTILRTTDGGVNWVSQNSGTSNGIFGVSFADANTGTAVVEDGTILRTTDGGVNWVIQYSSSHILRRVHFIDANTGTVVGFNGTILRTTDGGANWVSQNSGTDQILVGVFFTDANNGTVVGDGGTILRTIDGGATWVSQNSGTEHPVIGIFFTNANIGTAVGYNGTILRTTNGGIPPAQNSVLSFDGTDDYVEIPNNDKLNFGSSTDFTLEAKVKITGTTQNFDGIIAKGATGASWTGYQMLVYDGKLGAEISSSAGDISPLNGLVGVTNIADGNWHHVALVVERTATKATLYVDGKEEAAVVHSVISSDLNITANMLIGTERTNALYLPANIDEVRIWNVARTASEVNDNVNNDSLLAATTGLVAYYHFDQGAPSGVNSGLSVLKDSTPNRLQGTLYNFALNGDVSNWIESQNSVVTAIGDNDNPALPEGFTLDQNYPNPFNPSTTIRFALPKAGQVSLAIYNMQGQLIQTLASGQFSAGQHQAVWNGTNANGAHVASGVYFYKLKAGNVVQSKKMLLMK
ncbi:MAG: T9SS C-terminal target domain-containing protein [Calditrichaeota bacterium]|nr:MAG: T9SS C-terminal target domain-containing protein [Calditrichota bacterium]